MRQLTERSRDGVHTMGSRGVKSPCGRDRQILADYYPEIRVIVPTPAGLVSALPRDLLPLGFDWLAESTKTAS